MNLRGRKKSITAEVHTSAMNDIMFFLLLFFLLASTLTNPNVIKLLLPKSRSGKAISKKTVNVTVSKDLTYTVNNKPVTLADIPNALSGYKQQYPERSGMVHGAKTVQV